MDQQDNFSITPPSLPKGGGAIQSIGKGWGEVGSTGKASFDLPLPISPGRGFAPPLVLGYGSSVGNSLFGIGWVLSLGCVARRTSKGVPDYTDDDVMLGPDGTVWMAERGADGSIIRRLVNRYRGLELGIDYQVARYFPRIEGAFERIEHWRSADDYPGFWLVHGTDGSLHLYGFNSSSRSTDLEDHLRVGEWLLDESMNAHGEHLLYEYAGEDHAGMPDDTPRDFRAQCYLSRVRYGNAEANAHLYHWIPGQLEQVQWHFDLIFDYGERDTGREDIPAYEPTGVWPVRSDPFVTYGYGFLLGNLRLCRQVLMFHQFPELGSEPVLVQRLLLEYRTTELGYNLLSAAYQQGYDEQGQIQSRPPVEFTYSAFEPEDSEYQEFDAMPGLNDGQQYQLVDLYGEGIPGVLYRSDKAWYYREPLRAYPAETADEVVYDAWRRLDAIPVMDSRKPVRQSLMDLTGDGRLDWVVAQPGVSGFFTLNPDRSWSNFVTFDAFPVEFFHPQSQLADVMGGGLSDLALIGPRSVRLYANRRREGFASGKDVAHFIEAAPDDRLPLVSPAPTELVAFSDVLGSGQQHLVRIRHNEIVCWPNRGHGRFDPGFRLATLPYSYESFDASRVLLADLDGSGAADLIYLTSNHAEIFMNRTGMGFESTPLIQPWPPGVRYDRLCQVSTADLQGLGCSSLVITIPHMKPQHWRVDFVQAKPYLLHSTNNNMGAVGEVIYRSSAQEWLDEKQALLAANLEAVSYVPFPMPVAALQIQLDEITGNRLTQRFEYCQGFYDGQEREFRGFGLVLQTDSEVTGDEQRLAGYTAPVLRKSWFHTGRAPDLPGLDYDRSDSAARPLGAALLLAPQGDSTDHIISDADDETRHDMAYTLAGMPLRVEVFGLDADDLLQALPYSVQQSRYAVRLLQRRDEYQPYCRMQPLELESIAYTYERQPDDPLCQHHISLAWDPYGGLIHEVTVDYARRKSVGDEPPFSEAHEQTWWRAAHDDAQRFYYLNESRAQFIHLDDPQGCRLGLPYLSRGNALVLSKAVLGPEDISHEAMLDRLNAPATGDYQRVLTQFSVQRYQETGLTLPAGQASFEALADFLESAELDEVALQAYASVLSPEELADKLPGLGYRPIDAMLPTEPDRVLWSTRKGFMTYAELDGFYRLISARPTESQGSTDIEFDPYYCLPISVTTADGCVTRVADVDYRFLLPRRIVDPNQNVQEARYNGFGELSASSFHGTEAGVALGFDPIDEHQPVARLPAEAIAAPDVALQGAASACFRDAFSWMRQREPVHAAVLQADRYPAPPDNPGRKIRIGVQCWDGFGRILQTKQKVEPGDAYQIAADGTLVLDGDQPVTAPAAERWRVSERVEYNNKGLAVRVYRPYFADGYRYIKDESFRVFGYCDQQFYDPLGRPTLTLTAMGYKRRQRYLGWYGIAEDENDTWGEVEEESPTLPLVAILTVSAGLKTANGSDAHTATVTVKDANNRPVKDVVVLFLDIPDASRNPPSGRTNEQGLIETRITSTVPGTKRVTAILSEGYVDGSPTTVEFGSTQLVLEMASDNGLVSDTEKNNMVLATVRMGDGSLAPQGTQVTFDAVDDVVFDATSCPTAGSTGKCVVMIGSTVAKTHGISASVVGALSPAQVEATFLPRGYNPGACTLEPIEGTRLADGVDAHVATVTFRDVYGNPVTRVGPTGFILFPEVPGLTIDPLRCHFGEEGATTSTNITSELEGTYSITATFGDGVPIGQPQLARFVGIGGDESRSTFSVSEGAQPADGVSTHTVTAFIRDAADNPFAGATVYFGTTGATLLETTCVTGPEGTCSVDLVATTPGTKEVRANLNRRVEGVLVYLSNNPQSAQFS